MELTIQEFSAMLYVLLMSFAIGCLCWKYSAGLAVGLLAVQALAWAGGWLVLSLLSIANPNRAYQGLHDVLAMLLVSAVGILCSSFFVFLTDSNNPSASDNFSHGGSSS